MKTHELKCWPEFYTAILDRAKLCEIRKDDRNFAVGDELKLREWSPNEREYTGRWLTVLVTHVADGEAWGIVRGFVVMSIQIQRVKVGS